MYAYIAGSPFVMYLGDNLLQGGIDDLVAAFRANGPDALILLTPVPDPQHFGVAELDGDRVVALAEKPAQPRTNLALVGVYMFTALIHDAARAIDPSPRGELEITDLNRRYLARGELMVERLGRGYAWLDTGTHESLHQAANFIETIEERQGLKVACPEEIAYQQGWIDRDQLLRLAVPLSKNGYGEYLLALADGAFAGTD